MLFSFGFMVVDVVELVTDSSNNHDKNLYYKKNEEKRIYGDYCHIGQHFV